MYIGRGRDLRSFFVFNRLCSLLPWRMFKKEIVIFDEISFPSLMPLLERDNLQCPSAVN